MGETALNPVGYEVLASLEGSHSQLLLIRLKGQVPFAEYALSLQVHPLGQSSETGPDDQISDLFLHHPSDADDGCRGPGVHVHRPWLLPQNEVDPCVPAQT